MAPVYPQQLTWYAAILYRIWSIWFLIVFWIVYLLIFPFHWFLLRGKPSYQRQSWAHWLNIIWGRLLLGFSGIWVSVRRRAKIDRKQAYVFIANHNSYVDIPICHVAVPQDYRFIAKAELAKVPLFGWMYKRLHIMLNRESRIDAIRALKAAETLLKANISVFIYPEGSTHHPELLGAFKEGAFQVAVATQKPIIPVTILHSARAFSNDGRMYACPAIITVYIDDPIATEGMTLQDIPALVAKIRQIMFRRLQTD
jgi:1-acyl-sn-glycerol-3-phosphate acyltransferase